MSQNTESKRLAYVGVDDGHYAVKVVTEDGQTFSIPSRAKSGKHLISWQAASDSAVEGGIYVTDEDQVFTVHDHLTDCDDTRFREYPLSAMNRVLVHHALRKAGFAGRDVSIATGLPVAYYYLNSKPNTTLIDGKIANLKKGVRSEVGQCARIVNNIVTTEAIAAYFDQIIAFDGAQTPQYDEMTRSRVGIIDIGGKTTDCAVILPGGDDVESARSGSSDVGVLALNDAVEAALRTAHGFDNVPPSLVEQAVTNGTIKVYGREESVKGLVTKAKETLAEQIMGIVRTKIGSGKDLDMVLFVGGGSLVMKDQLMGQFPHARIPEQPEFANARGMLKIAKYVFGQQG